MIIRAVGWTLLAGLGVLLAGCASQPAEKDHSGRYTITQDRAPGVDFDVSGLEDAVPRFEAPRRAGNKSPYTVWGRSYNVLEDNHGYVADGMASWYGEKFHGHKTSNGEVFDMYQMTAAHKSLRIPSYARVTNLANGRSVIVRVNDRGPFHGDRMIDLSYAAAKRLGYQSQGVARVEVAAISVSEDGSMMLANKPFRSVTQPQAVAANISAGPVTAQQPVAKPAPKPASRPVAAVALQNEQIPANPQPLTASATSAVQAATGPQGVFVQLGSFASDATAEKLMQQAQTQVRTPMRVRVVDTGNGRFHRVQAGPFDTEHGALKAQQLLRSHGFQKSILLTDSR